MAQRLSFSLECLGNTIAHLDEDEPESSFAQVRTAAAAGELLPSPEPYKTCLGEWVPSMMGQVSNRRVRKDIRDFAGCLVEILALWGKTR